MTFRNNILHYSGSLNTKIKIDMVPCHWRMKESHLAGDKIGTMICSLHNIDCNYEYAMDNSLDPCPLIIHVV